MNKVPRIFRIFQNFHKTTPVIFFFILLLSHRYILANNEDITYNNDVITRDPFIPLVDENGNFRNSFIKPEAKTTASTMNIPLGGTSNINGVYYILIEGELLKEGDMYKEFKIEKISPEKAILSLRDKMYELNL